MVSIPPLDPIFHPNDDEDDRYEMISYALFGLALWGISYWLLWGEPKE